MKKEPQGDQIHDIQGFNFIDMTSSKQCTGTEPDIIDIFQKVCGFYTSTDSRKHLTSFRFNYLDHYFLLVPHHPPPLLMVLLLPWLQAKSPVYLILPVLLVPVAEAGLLVLGAYCIGCGWGCITGACVSGGMLLAMLASSDLQLSLNSS